MEKEFDLSSKICYLGIAHYGHWTKEQVIDLHNDTIKDVKEFIRRLKNKTIPFDEINDGKMTTRDMIIMIDKLAGKDLR